MSDDPCSSCSHPKAKHGLPGAASGASWCLVVGCNCALISPARGHVCWCGEEWVAGASCSHVHQVPDRLKSFIVIPARAETADEAMLRDQRQAQARSDAAETTAAFRAPAPDPRGGPFQPSPWGSHSNVGISPAKIFEHAYLLGYSRTTILADALAAFKAKWGLS